MAQRQCLQVVRSTLEVLTPGRPGYRPWSVCHVVPQDGWCFQNEEYVDLANQRVIPGIAERFHEGLLSQQSDLVLNTFWDSQPVKTDHRVSDMVGRLQMEDESRCCIQHRL